ncbi:MAG TPA: ATP-binding protein, partial [Candidatus Obscuribacter sp.]|nr:ATP-binding protein [Candidatus Obscuribacter sp.]
IADGVVVCDRDNRVQIVNRAATQIFDKEAKDLLGKPLVVCTEGPDQPQICHVVQQFTDTNIAPGSLEPIVQQLQLGELTVRLHTAPIFLNKEFLGSVMIMQDITKQAELEKMKNEFMANVSHELRTPITSIKSYVDTLCNHGEKLDPDIHQEFLQIIDNEADRLMHLVNDVLELSRIEEANREFEMLPMDIHRACEAAIRSLNLMARDRGIELVFEQAENIPLASINQESIERVVINLLNNAIKYTPEGGKITVKVAESEGKEVAVHVKDTGIGIPEDALEHVFDRFYRVEKKVHTIKGTGLGLTIVKKIIEKHGGRITVASAIGEGSTFSFYLPALAPSDEEMAAEESASLV